MKGKIYYLARSYHPYQKGGGPLMRKGAVGYLKKLGWDVKVIMPNYSSKELIIKNNITQIPFRKKHIQKLASLLERIGIYEDYLDRWVEVAFEYLKDKIQKEDIIFATTGGELGMIKLGSLLKEEVGCKFVANFRDPINYGYMNGLRRDKKFHIGRVNAHKKYILNTDLIITSSAYYAKVLKKWLPSLSSKIKNNYFGYIEKLTLSPIKKDFSKINIAYVGTIGKTQSPEILYKIWQELNDKSVEIYFIGNIKGYRALEKIKNQNISGVHFIEFLPHEKFLKFMHENIDIGFVSLVNDYFKACVPSKIYEYINLELPILGALPNGDGKEIINKNGYGKASYYKDIKNLVKDTKELINKDNLINIKRKISKDKELWAMENRILEVDKMLEELIK